MARRGATRIRTIEPDPIYKSETVTKLINRCMLAGKKSVAQKEVYEAFEVVKEKTKEDALKVFNQALENIKPTMEVRPPESRWSGLSGSYERSRPKKGITGD